MTYQTAPCARCGKPMQWTGKVWICCEHCGQMQLWEGNKSAPEEQAQNRRTLNSNLIIANLRGKIK